ncbi:hypothetical protein LCGC14_0985210 [marine sediment metagenome]|uniref:Abnormal spindle-like microcephaly-associated protein ASH domain-containing protein n=1 Tax=marine sediment metagenome TaxID=412755 RepID=A0A0F9N7H0_9ZZZZ
MKWYWGLLMALLVPFALIAPVLGQVFVYRADVPASATIVAGAAGLAFSPETLEFGAIARGGTEVRPVAVTNVGDEPLTFLYVRSTGLPQGVTLSHVVPPIFPVSPGEEVIVNLWLRAEWLASMEALEFTVVIEGIP